MTLTERTAYLKGLCEGLLPNADSPEAKLISEIIKTLDEMANDMQDIKDDTVTLRDYIEEIDEDLGDVESYVFEEDDEDGCDCCDCDEDDEDDEDFYGIECPSCGEMVYLDDSIDPDDVECPACGAKFSCVCDCCDCDDCEGECDCGCDECKGE